MTMLANRVQALAASVNDAEIKRRKDYYDYLCDKAPQYESFDQHVARYGSLFFHQDAFEELYDDCIVPLLSSSPATQTLSDLVLASLEPLQPGI